MTKKPAGPTADEVCALAKQRLLDVDAMFNQVDRENYHDELRFAQWMVQVAMKAVSEAPKRIRKEKRAAAKKQSEK